MCEAFRETLRHWMTQDASITLYGEDIEDPKGDVFGVTRGLSTAFPGRVKNSPVSESTIVGTSIGRALAGGRPVAFIQFADFLPLCFNQLATELGSMHWRTCGAWECPVIVMVACGGYRPGLGPFHSHTMEALACHVPGIDVAMPSTAADAAGTLNAAFESGRPTVIFYPKARLNDRGQATSADVARHLAPIGAGRAVRPGNDLTLVGWGNTVALCEAAAKALDEAGCSVDVIDLRWLSPWDETLVCESARKTGRLIVVHEDNRTAGLGAEVVATVAERVESLRSRRVTRPDTYVPCHFGNQLEVLPGLRAILRASAELLDLDFTWKVPEPIASDLSVVCAIGSSPADQTVTIAELHVRAAESVRAGDVLASLECDKAIFDLQAPEAGVVEQIHLREGQQVRVNTPLLTIRTQNSVRRHTRSVREESGEPMLRPRTGGRVSIGGRISRDSVAGLSSIYTVKGRESLTNAELARRFPAYTEDDIFQRTGIRSRLRASENQTVLAMAAEAARKALDGEGLALSDIDLLLCSTSTPPMTSPSLACLVLAELAKQGYVGELPAYDIVAACSGYLYALTAAWDFLAVNPDGTVLVVTAETMSRAVEPSDFSTVSLFADAATATVVYGSRLKNRWRARIYRPLISAIGDVSHSLSIGGNGNGRCVQMNGKAVFGHAVRSMAEMIERACRDSNCAVENLDLVIPHQANGRIIAAVRDRLRSPGPSVCNEVIDLGNTSSSSIPLALSARVPHIARAGRIGLCTFGAGFTSGACVIQSC
ncbi:MAG TPA: transketolase C-terminal domain-containing protein [Tepidisphaeraceae bacterium]|nr:transketolase C-terminal domain-containing protein [Tepidisphaeraceae bacterium]